VSAQQPATGIVSLANSPAPGPLAPLAAWWRALAPRERRLLAVGGAVLGLYLLWALAIAPAWRTLQRAPVELDALDAQLQTMQRLAAEAQQLRAAPPVNAEMAAAALKAATERLGDKGKLVLQGGERAVLTLGGVSTGELRAWLAEARSGARARPVEANLQRGAAGYSGSIVVAIGGGA
jgi:general secretion pathway protein M